MSPLDEEDVIDEFADRRQASLALNGRVERRRVFTEPAPPFLAFSIRVTDQFAECHRQRHRYFMTSEVSTILSGPRLSAAIPGSMAFRSPTITTASLWG